MPMLSAEANERHDLEHRRNLGFSIVGGAVERLRGGNYLRRISPMTCTARVARAMTRIAMATEGTPFFVPFWLVLEPRDKTPKRRK